METLKPHSEELAQVRRITEHHLFRGSESLCKLLRYLVEHAVNSRSEPLREFDIATDVFNRRSDFDPQSDSIVRVQIGRLRARLTRYYFEAGVSDPIVLEIPRGGYSLSISYRERPQLWEASPIAAASPQAPLVEIPQQDRAKQWRSVLIAVLVTALASVALIALISALRRPAQPAPLVTFWEPFLSAPVGTLVIYSNQVRVPLTADASRPESLGQPRALYTGIGEVMGAVALTHLFDRMGHDINFRGEAMTPWEDVKNSNLIFVGTATQSFKAIGNPERFLFHHHADDPALPLEIVDLKPEPGRPKYFGNADKCCGPSDEDYALVILSPGVSPRRVALTMFGTSTFGTQAAVEFVCDAASVSSMLRFAQGGESRRPPFFEALLRVRVRDNAPISSEIVTFYLRKQQR